MPLDRPSPGDHRYNAWSQDTWTHPDEAQHRLDYTAGADEVGLPPLVRAARLDDAYVKSISADRECEHGRLSGDPSPPCGCWDVERGGSGTDHPCPPPGGSSVSAGDAEGLVAPTAAARLAERPEAA